MVSNGVLDYNDAMERVETLRRSIEDVSILSPIQICDLASSFSLLFTSVTSVELFVRSNRLSCSRRST